MRRDPLPVGRLLAVTVATTAIVALAPRATLGERYLGATDDVGASYPVEVLDQSFTVTKHSARLPFDAADVCSLPAHALSTSLNFGMQPIGSQDDGKTRTAFVVRVDFPSQGHAVETHTTGAFVDWESGGVGSNYGPSCGYGVIVLIPSATGSTSGTWSMTDPNSSAVYASVNLTGTGVNTSSPTPSPSPPPTPAKCVPYIVLDSRGSGESGMSPPGRAFVTALQTLKDSKIVGQIENPYPATGVGSFLGAYLSLPKAYYRSVIAGKTWLRKELIKEHVICGTGTTFFLTGYSQGAQVAADVYQEGSYPYVKGVVLFGDPYFNNYDGYVDRGTYNTRLYGVLGQRPVFSSSRRAYVMSFCHLHDPVCQGSDRSPSDLLTLARYGFSQHENYTRLGEPQRAARYFSTFG